jgi:predicted anti-sigma-YlaC factor YlaD
MSGPDESLTPGSPESTLILLGEVRQALKDGNRKRDEMIARLDGVERTLTEVAVESRKNSAAVRCLERSMKDYEPMLNTISAERRQAEEDAIEARKAKATEWSRLKIGVVLLVTSSLLSSVMTGIGILTVTQRGASESRR